MPSANPFLVGGASGPRASLNRLPLVDLPGDPLPETLSGTHAYPALSGASLEALAGGCWDPAAWTEAQAVTVTAFGRLFGRLLCQLKRPSAELMARRPEWKEADWSWWASRQEIQLAGGIFRGAAGAFLHRAGAAVLCEQGLAEGLKLTLNPWAEAAPLTGAALGTAQEGWVCAIDAGQTSIKRGLVLLREGRIEALKPLSSIDLGSAAGILGVEELRDLLLRALEETRRAGDEARKDGIQCAPVAAMSLANYLPGGALLDRGLYGRLGVLGSPFRDVLQASWSTRAGSARSLAVFHDGSAAAFHLVPGSASAIIVAGTALGVGFAREC